MLKNDLKLDCKLICARTGDNWSSLGRKAGRTRQAISQMFDGKIISQIYLEVMESLGYDIQISYVPREKK